MFNGLRIFAPPEFPVLSLEVQARLPVAEAQEQSQFRLLVRHFLERFFNNDMVSADGETKARLLQVRAMRSRSRDWSSPCSCSPCTINPWNAPSGRR